MHIFLKPSLFQPTSLYVPKFDFTNAGWVYWSADNKTHPSTPAKYCLNPLKTSQFHRKKPTLNQLHDLFLAKKLQKWKKIFQWFASLAWLKPIPLFRLKHPSFCCFKNFKLYLCLKIHLLFFKKIFFIHQ